MKIFEGKKIAEKILLDLKKKIKQEKIKPKLAIISLASDPASRLFIKNKKKASRRIGIKVNHYQFDSRAKKEKIIKKIRDLNNSPSVNGILIQLPLPKGFEAGEIIKEINPQKDIDGFREESFFSSPLISAILIALKDSKKDLKNKKIIALVNSDIFGQALKKFLRKKKIKINYFLRKEISLPKLKKADIIISVCGDPQFITGQRIKKGAMIIDGGIKVFPKRKIVGDADQESLKNKASFLTPVPGGLGPLTVALLLKNVYLGAKLIKRKTIK